MSPSFRSATRGLQPNEHGRRAGWHGQLFCPRWIGTGGQAARATRLSVPVAVVLTAVLLGAVLVGCSGSSDGVGTAAGASSPASVPEAYPGVICPVDVDPKTAPATASDGRDVVGLPMEQKVAFLVAKHGVEAVIALRLDGCPSDTGRLINQRIAAAAPGGGFFSQTNGDRTVAYLAPVPDVQRFADRLDLGETTVDSEKRVVLVKVDPAKLAGEAAAQTPRMATLPRRKREPPPHKPSWHFTLGREAPPNSVLVTVRGADAKIADAVVDYVRQKNPTLEVFRHEIPGQACVLVCGGVEDIDALGERLDLGTVNGIDPQEARIDVTFDLARVMQSAGPGAAALFDPNSVEWAIEELKSGDNQVRFWALKRVQETPPSEPLRGQVFEALRPLLLGDDRSIRTEAIRTLAVWGNAQVVPDLVELFDDADVLVRQEAIRALGQLNDEHAIEPLCGLLGKEYEAERALIAMGPAVEDAVLASLDPTNEDQFDAACDVLCEVGTRKSLEKLGPFYLRPMGPLHNAAWGAVSGIRRRLEASGEAVAQSGPESAAPGSLVGGIDVVAGALENLKSSDSQDIRRACDLLAHAEPDPQRREEVARTLTEVVDNENDFVRMRAANALAVWYTPESIPKVIELTKDRLSPVRKVAIRILGEVKTKSAVEALLDCFPGNTHSVTEALKAMGPAAEDAILRRMDSPPMRDMSNAYHLLAEIGTEKCVNKLRQVSSERMNLENQSRVFAALHALRWWEQFVQGRGQDKSGAGEPVTPAGDAATGDAKPRTWTDSTGQFKVIATLAGFKDGQVTLKRSDGSVVTLPLERLCKADQEFVKRRTGKPQD